MSDDKSLASLDASPPCAIFYSLWREGYGRRSIILTSQLPVDKWHYVGGYPTYADAVLDRVAHNAHRINHTGESPQRVRTQLRAD